MANDEHFDFDQFEGFVIPRYTPIPDSLLDFMLPDLKGSELKVLLYIFRHTTGYKKASDNISFTQLLDGVVRKDGQRVDRGTGLGREAISKATKGLEAKRLITITRRRVKGRQATSTYTPHFVENTEFDFRTLKSEPTRRGVTQEGNDNETASLSLAIDIAQQHGNGPRDRKALTTSLSKFPVIVLEKVGEQLDQRVAEGEVENPAAYANRLAQVFAEAEAEAQTIREAKEQQTFDTILSTAVFEQSDGQTPADLRKSLLQYWPAEEALIQRAVALVST